MKKLSARESLFCRMYVFCRNGRESAYKAGYTVCPEIASKKLLAQEKIRSKIAEIEKENAVTSAEVKDGLRRIAFASSSDAIKLAATDDFSETDLEGLDLFNISEIKRAKNGGVEIKFFDRIKALEKLGEFSEQGENNSALPFYSALEQSAARLGSDKP